MELATFLTSAIVITIAIALFYIIAFIITLFDIIRDKNWIWLLIVMIFPFLGMILYWLFGNIK